MKSLAVDVLTDILDHTTCELGEGPSYDPHGDRLFWFDIVGKKMLSHDFTTGETDVTSLPFMASMSAMVNSKTQLIAAQDGLYLRDLVTGKLTLNKPLECDNTQTRSNDGRVHASGALWIGTMGIGAQPAAGAIYWYLKGELRQLFSQISIPNAICFSPDGSTAYFTDTPAGRLNSVEVDKRTGLPVGQIRTHYLQLAGDGGIDGAIVDRDGTIWIACWGAGKIIAISDVGEKLHEIVVPVAQPTCPAFVTKRLDKIALTSAWQGIEKQRDSEIAYNGKTLLLDIDVKGRAECRVAL